jgi:C4-dicarboxylate-binding protein DctP
MINRLSLQARGLLLALFVLLPTPFVSAEDRVYVMRVSTENTAEHVQTQAIEAFAQRLEAASGGRIDVQFHHSAQLFRDRDVIAALASGKVEMAVPGMWQLDRYVPDVGLYMLPLFYGRSAQEHYRVRDGATGQAVNHQIEVNLGVIVPGRWLDLGHANLYFTDRAVTRHEDLSGLRIRIPGGAANRGRLQAFGADPVVIAWPDLPDALARGQALGVLTTHETVRSAELWRNGIRYGFEDMEYFAQYVPMINQQFWQRLPFDLRQQLRVNWEQIVDMQRQAASQAQEQARRELLANGVRLIAPAPEALAHWRAVAREHESVLVEQMGIEPTLLRQAEQVLAAE